MDGKGVRTAGQPLTERCTDRSTEAGFAFSFYCDRCGNEWQSTKVPYDRAGFSEICCDEAEARIWMDEHRLAFERANTEALFHFNYCPLCGRWLCDRCFSIEGGQRYEACPDCLSALSRKA